MLWKVDQLIRALCPALNNRNLIAAATVARALIELAAAFGVETRRFADLLKKRKAAPAPDVDSLCDFHHESTKLVGQILSGTKLGPKGQPESGIERTNILTLIDKASDTGNWCWRFSLRA